MRRRALGWIFAICLLLTSSIHGEDIKKTEFYGRIKAAIDAVPAIDTHDHLQPFDKIPNRDETDRGQGMTLRSIWAASYYPWVHPLPVWSKGASFDRWWKEAAGAFDNARAASFYRYLLPAFQDLYGVDFDTITPEQARQVNDRIFENYRDDRWLTEVITKRANIELMLIDSYWAPLNFHTDYPFTVLVLNINGLVRGFHPGKYKDDFSNPYRYAREHNLPVNSLDDYLALLDRIVRDAKQAGAVCLKQTLAYQRPLKFENVRKQRAAAIFGRPADELSRKEVTDFEDFIMWRLVELCAKHDLPIQIHTGYTRAEWSNPNLLVDLIESNKQTKFILFHGGFPWVEDIGRIAMTNRNVWLDSVWLPTMSYTMARRAYEEWLDMVPSDRILWGSDTAQAEGIYAATVYTRRCLAEALAEKVDRGELREDHAIRIGRQVMRDNALALFPTLRDRVKK